MGFALKQKESVPKGLRRLAAERIDAALKSLKDCGDARSVHGVRKDIKRVRAVLRMARPRISKKAYRRQSRLLRQAADRLAPARDAYVKEIALRHLRAHFRGQLGSSPLRRLRHRLADDLDTAQKQFARKNGAARVRRLLRRIPKEFKHLEFEAKGWKALSPGVRSAYAAGRKAWKLARNEPSPEHWHEWRKRVKDLWYQARVLRSICPRELDALAAQLKTLSEHLGDDHDLQLLQDSVQAESGAQLELLAPGVLHDMIARRRSDLQSVALRIGEQVYAERPAAFCARLSRAWTAWRDTAAHP